MYVLAWEASQFLAHSDNKFIEVEDGQIDLLPALEMFALSEACFSFVEILDKLSGIGFHCLVKSLQPTALN